MTKQAERSVSTVEALISACQDGAISRIVVPQTLTGVPSFRLARGQTLLGAGEEIRLIFAQGQEGLQLSSDNEVRRIHLETAPEKRAIYNDTSAESLGRIVLRDLVTRGRVQILAKDNVRGGHVEGRWLDIVEADASAESERPEGFGVHVLQGAFTLWNQQSDESISIAADLTGLSAGRQGAPVRGGGIFVSGAGDSGGRLHLRRLETEGVYSDGGIAPGTPDQISGGVFTVYGVHADLVRNRGPVTTYGQNDMVLDNWGLVDRWIADDKITSHGPSGIGFVNFGVIGELRVNAPIETFGKGARGFNVYAGTVRSAEFDRVITHGDGAVGIQISQPVGRIAVRRGVETFGGTGDSLVKGVVMTLSAIALSIKPGGATREIEIAGGLKTNGRGVVPIEQHGQVDILRVSGGCVGAGGGFEAI